MREKTFSVKKNGREGLRRGESWEESRGSPLTGLYAPEG